MDVESFIKEWWSGSSLDYRQEVREWMERSYTQPFSFWEDLFSYSLKEIGGSSPTVVLERYDFYSDCIVRHLGRNLKALTLINAEGETNSWTYDQIHAYVDIQMAYWKGTCPLSPGHTVALLFPYGIEYIVALMTSLRLGLIISILPQEDRFFSQDRLESTLDECEPDLIVTSLKTALDPKWKRIDIDLSLEKTSKTSLESYSYLAGEMVQKHLNLDKKPTLIEATRSYLIPLRDAIVALRLKKETCFARPLLSMALEEPFSTIMALLVGSTTLCASDKNLNALKKESIDVLSVPPHLMQLWLKDPVAPIAKLKLWYRNPLYGNDTSWKAFSELNNLQKVPACQMIFDREKGGMTLFSQPKPLEELTFLHPTLGSPWKLLKASGNGQESTEGFGYFSTEPEGSSDPSLIISQVGDAWCISGSKVHLQEGQPYPIQLVEESVKTLNFVQTCMIVPERHPQHFYNKQFNLLVFVSPKERLSIEQKKAEWRESILDLIESKVGKAYHPDRCLFYSLYPKIVKGQPHRNWIENQYKSGAFLMKQNRSIYHTLNLIRQSIYEVLAYSTHHP
jgi:hypothetical protein